MKRIAPVLLSLILAVAFAATAAAAPAAPTGVSAIGLDGRAEIAWQPVAGASGYTVYRGTGLGAITTLLTPAAGVTGTSFTDTTVTNGTSYRYVVRAVTAGVESPDSVNASANPRNRSCSSGNAVVQENCFAGDSGWRLTNPTDAPAGIEGFATAPSINKGGSVDLKVNAAAGAPYHIEVYRSGYYGGAGARLVTIVRGLSGVAQPACSSDGSTGLLDCSNWSVSATLTTTASWQSGVYLVRLVREDNGTDNQILLVVRDDGRNSDLLYGVAFSDYQSYNNYGGKSLYDFNSGGGTTVSGTARAVKVSFDRPFEQPVSGLRDWYPRIEYATVFWLEREGFDVAYQSNTDLERSGSRVLSHHAYVSPAHDEYWSAGMRSALQAARDAGVNLFFTGSNEVYWKIRFEASPLSGVQDRVQVCYKSTQSGGPDPSGIPTGTWRDPAGANQPENALSGQMYVGDNDTGYFPLVVSAAQGADRLYRYTGLDAQAPGTSTSIGNTLVGWEWDARAANGQEPAGTKTLASSPVTGELIQNNGRNTVPGSTQSTMTKYTAASGALVVTTGTNHFNRGLAINAFSQGEPDLRIQQFATNVLEDMGAVPQTASSGIVLDTSANRPPAPSGVTAQTVGSDSVRISWSPVLGAGGYHVYRALVPREGGQPLGTRADGTTISGTSFTDTGLDSATNYYYVVTSVANGVQSLASAEVRGTTAAAAGQATRINVGGPDYTSSAGQLYRADVFATGGATNATTSAISGTPDPGLYQDERFGVFSYAIPVTNGTYDVRLHFAELYYGTSAPGGAGKRVFSMDVLDTPGAPDIQNLDIYAQVGARAALVKTITNVTVNDGTLDLQSIRGPADDPELTAIEIVPAPGPPVVTAKSPADGSSGVARGVQPTATFSADIDPATLTGSSFTLTPAGGSPVAASVTYDAASRTATLTPAAALAYSTTYTARLATTIAGTDGRTLASPVTWTFTTLAPVPLTVSGLRPAAGTTGVGPGGRPRATFSRSVDPTTVTPSSFTLTPAGGSPVAATVVYDDTTKTAELTPTAPLALGVTYTATLTTAVRSADDVALGAPVSWSFTTATTAPVPLDVTTRSPGSGATGVLRTASVSATFNRALDPATVTSGSVTLTGPSGAVAATVSYDGPSQTARLVPQSALSYGTTYTARLAGTIQASDGTPLGSAVTWSFTTVDPPPPPAVVLTTPADGAGSVSRATSVTASFSRAMDPATLTASSFTVAGSDGVPVAATVAYDGASNVATLTPSQPLAAGVAYTARLDTTVRSQDGVALAAPVTWAFSTAACPCSLFSVLSAPSVQNISVQDGRVGTGPFSYELGVKVRVDVPMRLTAIRFYKSGSETGTHVGRVWSAAGTQLASATFAGESASGWQSQALATPLLLQANTTYVVSVNANAYFSVTPAGLQSAVVSGPLRSVADGQNGVFANTSGLFPTQSYNSGNYFVDVDVSSDPTTPPPSVTAIAPADGATGVSRTAGVRATFSRPVDPASVTTSTFTLRRPDGSAVPASVSYDAATTSATLTPSSALSYSTTYTARVGTGVRGTDGVTLASAAQASFTVVDPVPPRVTSTLPVNGASDVGPGARVRAYFSKPLDPTTVTSSTFTLSGPSGAVSATVSYDATADSATLVPAGALSVGTTYTARLDASISATDQATLGTPYTWSFTPASVPPLAVSATNPAAGATGLDRGPAIQATFSRTVDPATLTTATFRLRAPDSSLVSSSVSFDPSTQTATLSPLALLAARTTYTAEVTTGVQAADGSALPAQKSWSFTTGDCPCSLFPNTLAPASTGNPTSDGRSGAGPFTYELGVKVVTSQAVQLTAIRFYKSPGETGTHVGRVWSASGTPLGSVTFSSETASGWQQQALATPINLQPGSTYVVSVNANTYFVVTGSGLAAQVTSGPLSSVADGANGVFANSAGLFPTGSYRSGNYFVDAVVR